MEHLEWAATGLCLVLVLWLGGWLLLDKRREIRQARYAGRLALRYQAARSYAQPITDYTWPIVAQQPATFYETAATIPIPQQLPHPETVVRPAVPMPPAERPGHGAPACGNRAGRATDSRPRP